MSRLNMDLIEAIYSESDRELTNNELYREVQSRLAIPDDAFNAKKNSVGRVFPIINLNTVFAGFNKP